MQQNIDKVLDGLTGMLNEANGGFIDYEVIKSDLGWFVPFKNEKNMIREVGCTFFEVVEWLISELKAV